MIRVYFDLNIVTHLRKKKETEEPYKTIFSVIKDHNHKLLFPYSFAHLQDLKRGYSKSETAKEQTYKDLNFLQEISKGHCLYGEENKDVNPAMINVVEYFDELCSKDVVNNFDFENIFTGQDSPEIAAIWKDYLLKLKALPGGLDFTKIDDLPGRYDIIKTVFEKTREQNSFYNVLRDISKLLMTPDEQNNLYITLRNATVDDLKIDTNSKNWGNAYKYLDKHLPKTKMNKTFDEVVNDSLEIFKKGKPLTKFNYFTTSYLSLDSMGYYRDKEFYNLIYDAIHSYFGAHCDYFITEDKNTYEKTVAIYQKLGISTKVCKASDFLEEYFKANQLSNHNKNINERIDDIINNSLILLNTVNDVLDPVTVHKVDYPLFDYFNRMQITSSKDATTLTFYRNRKNYSEFMFWTEVEVVVNKIVENFGADDHYKWKFDYKSDREDITNQNWGGRTWLLNNVLFEVTYNPAPFGLSFNIIKYK